MLQLLNIIVEKKNKRIIEPKKVPAGTIESPLNSRHKLINISNFIRTS